MTDIWNLVFEESSRDFDMSAMIGRVRLMSQISRIKNFVGLFNLARQTLSCTIPIN
jgi:hypothetical protein